MRSYLNVALVVLLGAAACTASPTSYACTDSAMCIIGGHQGTCEASGLCSLSDPACPSGRRYEEFTSPELAGTCVPLSGDGCENGVDDDEDGLIDTADPGCSSSSDGDERGTDACDNGTDDDGDGTMDFRADGMGDAGCASPAGTSELSGTACNDGVDDDADLGTDYRVDATGDTCCFSVAGASEGCVVAFRAGGGAAVPSGILTLTINTPAGTVADDVMIASISVRPPPTITAPAGWTLVGRVDNLTANTEQSVAVYRKVAGPAEPASYAWTFSTSAGAAGGIQSFSGVDTVTPVDVQNGQTTAASLMHPTPSVATTVINTMLVTTHSFSSAATWTPPVGMTEAFDLASLTVPNAAGISIEANHAPQAARGATGAKVATASNDSGVGNAFILALRPR